MEYTKVLKRAWHMVWRYRALWIFGVILALTTFSWGATLFPDRDNDWEEWGIVVTRLPGETFFEAFQRTMREEVDEANRELNEFLAKELHIDMRVDVLTVIAVLAGIAVVACIVAKVARYVSETALIRMVGEYEGTGEPVSVRQGFRMGWSRSAWRLFLIDLLVTVLAVLAGVVLFALIFAPLPLWVNGSEGVIFAFALLTAGLFFLAIVVVIVAGAAVSLVRRFAWQACVREGVGVIEAIRQGYGVVRRHLKDVGLTWLITLGVRVGWSVAIVPVVFLLLGAGVLVGGLPALAAGGLASLASAGDTPVFVALAVGVPTFLLVLIAPLVFLEGLREVFLSSVWTLAYGELRPAEAAEKPRQVPGMDASGLEAAPVA